MAVTFHIPGPLRSLANGTNRIEIHGSPSDVSQALDELWQVCPAVRFRILTEQGAVREHLNIFVGDECIRFTGGLQTPVPNGCEIFIIPAVSGG
jgi:molybdopterin synthase sulfur carrier subunit